MAARLRLKHQDDVRRKIQVSQLLNRLEKQAATYEEVLSTVQLRCIELLLKKSLPDLSSVEHTGDPDNPVEHKAIVEYVNAQNPNTKVP